MADQKNSGNKFPESGNLKNRRIPSAKRKGNLPPKKIILLTILTILICSSIIVGGYTIYAIAKTPAWDPQMLYSQNQSSIVYDANSEQIAQLHADENRLPVKFEEIPDMVKKTVIAVEDKRFYEHHGLDPIRLVKAIMIDIRARSYVEGSSTLTMQLAKNAFISDPQTKTIERKIQELILSLKIEKNYTKDEILTFYLNRIFFGESSFGIRTAAQTYFGKELKDLNPAEIALLAGLPQAPSAYDPYVDPEKAEQRRTIVLSVMRDNNIITPAEYEEYKNEPFTFVEDVKKKKATVKYTEANTLTKTHPYYVDYVINELQKTYNITPNQIYKGGLKIYTTCNSKVQQAAEDAFADPNNFPASKDNTNIVQGAMTVLDPQTGAIAAMVGGREYTTQMGFNRAWQATRQPGSTIKPLTVYSPAIEKGSFYPGSVFDDMPVSYADGSGGYWAPVDYDTETSGWKGLITMRTAVNNSVNVYAVKLMNALGIDYAWDFAKNRLGLPLTEKDKVLSLSLGTCQVSTLDMASAYATFPANGIKSEPYSIVKVTDQDGKVIAQNTLKQQRVMKETTAYVMNDLLRTVVTSGTGTRANLPGWYICGKTGTTSLDPNIYGNKSGNPDAWFVGYSPKFVGVVWMGYDSDPDKNHYLYKVYGGSYPTTIWKKVMTVAHSELTPQSSIAMPAGITSVQFDRKSGFLPSNLTPKQFISTEICPADNVPVTTSNVWINVKVDPANPNVLAPEEDPYAIDKLVLNVTGRSEGITWPGDEAPYKMPGKQGAPGSDTSTPPGTSPPDSPDSSPPAGNTNIPTPSLGKLSNHKQTISLPVDGTFDSDKYTIIVYLKQPDQSSLKTIASEGASRTVLYDLNSSGKIVSGTYTFWAALMDNTTFNIGPPSNAQTIEIQ